MKVKHPFFEREIKESGEKKKLNKQQKFPTKLEKKESVEKKKQEKNTK